MTSDGLPAAPCHVPASNVCWHGSASVRSLPSMAPPAPSCFQAKTLPC